MVPVFRPLSVVTLFERRFGHQKTVYPISTCDFASGAPIMSGSGDTSQICSITTRCTWHMIALNKVVKLISQYASPIDSDVFNAFLKCSRE